MEPNSDIRTFGEVTALGGNHRLILRFIAREFTYPRGGAVGYDFHSIIWEVRVDDDWAERIVITQEDFERDAPRRWIRELHTIDPVAGTAIIKVGEEQPPDAAGSVHVEYTWRERDLVHNRQRRVIRVCDDSFGPFEGKGTGGTRS